MPIWQRAMTERKRVSLDKIAKGRKIASAKDHPDEKDKLEEKSLGDRRSRAEISALEHANRDRVATRRLRYRYAKAVYQYLCGYSIGAAVMTVASGFKIFGFTLPDAVLTMIVGSTAAAAIGLVGFVVSGLFKNTDRNSK